MLDTVILTIIYGLLALWSTAYALRSLFEIVREGLLLMATMVTVFGVLSMFFWYQLLRVWGVI